MKSITLCLLSCSVAFAVSCNKDDDDVASGPSVSTPGINLVAGDQFKNTAKNGREVSQKLDAGAANIESTQLTMGRNARGSDEKRGVGILNSHSVVSFLSGGSSAEPSSSSEFSIATTPGSSCGQNLNFVNDVYNQTGMVLRGVAQQLAQVEESSLPQGVTSTGPTEQFAVTYQIDLGQMKVQTDDSQEQSGTSEIRVAGQAKIGAGADAESAVVALGVDSSVQGEGGGATYAGGFAVSVNDTKQILKLNSDGRLALTMKDSSGRPGSAQINYSSMVDLRAGVKPSLHLIAKIDGNADVSNGSAGLSQESHTMVMDVTVAQVSENEVSVAYKITTDGQTQNGNQTYVAGDFGECEIKSAQ